MEDSFTLDYSPLKDGGRFSRLADLPGVCRTINSPASFNAFCRQACRAWQEVFPAGVGAVSRQFRDLSKKLEESGGNVIRAPWGGVVITRHEPPQVEKFLVIRKGGYLALEKHTQKDERLEVREGAGLILAQQAPGDSLSVRALSPGMRFHFEPGMTHCLIGCEDLLVFENSIDPKGMDKDLVFIFEPDETQLSNQP